MACANVAGLLTSRAPARAGEIALRLALGAGRGRLVRQLLIENTVLAAAGGAAGLAVGYAGVLLWRQLAIPSELPFDITSRMDGPALAVSLGVAVASVFLFGLLPAVQTTRASMVSTPRLSRYSDEQTRRFYEQLVERSRLVTGVDAVSMASFIPMSNSGAEFTEVIPEGYVFPQGTESAQIATNRVATDFFRAMGTPIVRGRAFSAGDAADIPRVAVVNQRLADRYWPAQDPIGRRFRIGGTQGPWVEVVGIVPTGKCFGISETPIEFLYLAYHRHPPTRMTLLVQSAGEPLSLVESMRGV